MLTVSDAFYQLKNALSGIYDSGEAAAIAHSLLEHITGMDKMQRIVEKDKPLSETQKQFLKEAAGRLLKGEPLQHITGIQWFCGRPFFVNRNVLIPRPETEELIEWIRVENRERKRLSILDIGTGTGCIPVSLKKNFPDAQISSCDISEEALQTAAQNAQKHKAAIRFLNLDFLKEQNWSQLGFFNIIVSNPPYIPFSEKESLDRNVRDFEPAAALFVPSEDPLLFYRKIADFGKRNLFPGGAVYAELHQDYALAAKALFEDKGYREVILKKDIFGNSRMLKASDR